MMNRSFFPPIEDEAHFEKVIEDRTLWTRVGHEIRRQQSLGDVAVEPIDSGSTIVVALGLDHVAKLSAPLHDTHYAAEALALHHLSGALPIATPTILAEGRVDDWRYILMQRIPGQPLKACWDSLTVPERCRLAEHLGAVLAVMHALPTEPVSALGLPWPAFISEQGGSAVERQRAWKVDEVWLEQIPDFLAETSLEAAQEVLLHTEIMREHVFAVPTEAGYELSGLIDFEPAMVGAPEYEFASVGLFISSGEAAVLKALCLGYGYQSHQLDAALQRRFMAYVLLHRYSCLKWYFKFMPMADQAQHLDALAKLWFAFD